MESEKLIKTLRMKTVLVIGKNGQLGQHLVKYFQDNYPEFKLVGTVRHKSYDFQPQIYDESSVLTETLDLTDQTSIEEVVKRYKPDYIFNSGANAFVGESWVLPEQHLNVNGLGVLRLLEAVKKFSPESVVVNLGTSEEFACTLKDKDNGAQNEETKIDPKSPYACAKSYARYIVDVYRNSYGIKAIQPWTFNFESKLRHQKYVTRKITSGVARIFHALKNKESFEPIKLGNLNSYRSWQHAMDVADALWKVANQNSDAKNWKPYVISENKTHSIREFVEKSFGHAGINGQWFNLTPENPLTEEYILCEKNGLAAKKKVTLVKVSKEFFRPHDVDYLFGCSNKIREELNWRPKYSLDDIIKEMVEHDINELA